MNFWFENTGIIIISILSIIIGRNISRLSKPYWLLGYFIPFIVIVLLIGTRLNNSLFFLRPFNIIMAGKAKFVILSIAICIGLTVPLSRLPHKWERIVVSLVMAGLVIWSSILPLFLPVVIKEDLACIKTRFDVDGVCRQSKDYTCGPAAAVTALAGMGLEAEEGEIAILSYTSPVTGTLPNLLCSAIEKLYGDNGLKCRYQHFDSVEQLKKAGIILVVVKEAFLKDHCLVVLEITEDSVAVADPVTGKRIMPYEMFEKIWRFSGIVIEQDSTRNI